MTQRRTLLKILAAAVLVPVETLGAFLELPNLPPPLYARTLGAGIRQEFVDAYRRNYERLFGDRIEPRADQDLDPRLFAPHFNAPHPERWSADA